MRLRTLLCALLAVFALARPSAGQSSEDKINYLAVPTAITIGGSTFSGTSSMRVSGLATKSSETECLWINGSGDVAKGACGTVTSVALSVPSEFGLSGSPITTSGTLALTWANASANSVFQRAGTSGVPSFSTSLSLGGTLGVTGASTLAALSATTGSFSSTLGVTGATTLSSTLGVTGAATFANNTGTSSFASRTTGWRVSAAGDADVRSLFVDALSARSFTADLEQVVVGSQRVTKSSSTISQTFTCPALGGTSTLWVDDIPSAPNLRVFASGESVSIRTFTRTDGDADGNLDFNIADCVGVVTSYADGTAGNDRQQSWTFTRNAGANGGDMTASTNVPVKTLALDYGTSGMGFAEVTAVDGAEGQNAPYYQLATWTTAPVSGNFNVRCRLGKLAGMWDYAAGGSIFGLACGDSAATNITMDPTNGFRIRFGTADKFKADTSGNLSLTGDLAMGTAGVIRSGATAIDTATGYWLAHNAGTPQFRIGTMSGSTLTKGIRWDGTNLKVKSNSVTIDENGIVVIPATGSIASLNSYSFDPSSSGSGTNGLFSYYSTSPNSRVLLVTNAASAGWDVSSFLTASDGTDFGSVGVSVSSGIGTVSLGASDQITAGIAGVGKVTITSSEVTVGSTAAFRLSNASGTGFYSGEGFVGVGRDTQLSGSRMVVDQADRGSWDTWGNFAVATNTDQYADRGGVIAMGGRHTDASSSQVNFAIIAGRKATVTSGDRTGYLAMGTTNAAGNNIERVRLSSTQDAATTFDLLSRNYGTGNLKYGSILGIGRNTSGNGAAGSLALYAKDGTAYFLWVDATGKLRIATAPPDEDGTPSDTSGTVVGTQS